MLGNYTLYYSIATNNNNKISTLIYIVDKGLPISSVEIIYKFIISTLTEINIS